MSHGKPPGEPRIARPGRGAAPLTEPTVVPFRLGRRPVRGRQDVTCSNRRFGSASGNVPLQNRGSVLRAGAGKLGSLSGAGFFQLPPPSRPCSPLLLSSVQDPMTSISLSFTCRPFLGLRARLPCVCSSAHSWGAVRTYLHVSYSCALGKASGRLRGGNGTRQWREKMGY